MENLIKDLQSICRQYGYKVDTMNPTIDADGRILDITIFMKDDEQNRKDWEDERDKKIIAWLLGDITRN